MSFTPSLVSPIEGKALLRHKFPVVLVLRKIPFGEKPVIAKKLKGIASGPIKIVWITPKVNQKIISKNSGGLPYLEE